MMARPLRRVITQLSIRLGISPREIEQWSMETIREFVAELTAKPKGSRSLKGEVEFLANPKTPEQLAHGLATAFGPFA